VTNDPTRILNQTMTLGTNPDDIRLEEQNGQAFIVLGNISIALNLTSQDALDKLATVTAHAAANARARRLREVA